MSTRRTAAAAISAVILLGGGATALAATTGAPARPDLEATAPQAAAPSTDTTDTPDTADTEVASSEESPESSEPAPSTTSVSTTDDGPADGTAGISGRFAAPSTFGAMSMPPDWNGSDDPGTDITDITDDGPGLPFQFGGMSLDTLTALARSVGIELGVPVVADDGSITVTVTLPDGSEHAVWIGFDDQGRIADATVDGTPVMEFVRQFLAGEIGRPAPPVEPHPEWNLPD
jgi:hypothetical protein